ncbi:hypothetical protein QQ045_033651 [Rhodiola kirilowii]
MAATKNNMQEVSATEGRLLGSPFSFIAIQMALKVVIELNILEILAESGPPGTQLSTPQIVSKLPTTNPNPKQAVTSLYRILRFLSSHSFLTTSLPPEFVVEENDRLFGLTTLTATTMVRGDEAVLPMSASLLLFVTQKELWESFEKLKFTVLNPEESRCSFEMAHGVGLYDYLAQKPNSDFTNLFDQVMASSIKPYFDSVIRVYNGFDEVTELMDVGGNHGSALERIISFYPNIKGCINFDLPGVISRASPLKGVKHVAGDMFQALPASKTIMLKSDEECVKLLRNCWRSLPEEGGKVIVLELVIADDLEISTAEPMAVNLDFYMLVLFCKGKERTVPEFRNLAVVAGFSCVNVVPIANEFHVLEFLK